MNLKNYKNLYKNISNIVNEIDPGYYNGPSNEYDFQVNGIIKLIEAGQIDNYDQFIKLFFGERKDISDEEQKKIEQVMDKISSSQIKK